MTSPIPLHKLLRTLEEANAKLIKERDDLKAKLTRYESAAAANKQPGTTK